MRSEIIMNNYAMKSFVRLGLVLIIFSLTACGYSNEDRVTEGSMIKENAEIILEGIKEGDYESIAELFSPYIQEKYPDLQNDITELMEYIDGDIISYEGVYRDTRGGHSTEEGWVEKGFEGGIYNVKTSNGRFYNIEFGGYYIYKEKPEKEGITDILIESLDELDEEGYHVEKSIYYQ